MPKKSPKKPAPKVKAKDAAVSAPSPKKAEVKITAAKGRPMLTWVGKRPLSHVTAFPAQHVETFSPSPLAGEGRGEGAIWKDWPSSYPKGGLLFHGDNKEVLAHLLANGFRGKVNLICLDPPFDSGADYVRKVSLRGPKGTAKIDGETYALGEQIQYTDIWANDNYLQFMYERLMLMKELLHEKGTICLHCDSGKSHHLRCLLDEVFGTDNFLNEVIWDYRRWPSPAPEYQKMHDNILIYTKQKGKHTWNRQYMKRTESTEKRWKGKAIVASHHESGERKPSDYGTSDSEGSPLNTVWYVPIVAPSGNEREGYPTQKPEGLLERLLLGSSSVNDLVLDCFIGAGTTAAVAQKLGRRWIGCDINNGAIQTTSKRLQTIINEQGEAERNKPLTLPLASTDDDSVHASTGSARTENQYPNAVRPELVEGPAQSTFSIWRVNDYDLAIQHNEAVNLACEHIGVERMRTDAYFDGTYRKSLVKIIPFGHPLTPLDLEELRRELEARPDEDRPITVVCLGMELAAKAWVEDWNRLRKGKDAVNKIDVIELRTDPKYGKFMRHEPAKAKVKVSRKKDKITVEIEDFISPTIIERLSQQAGLLKPKIDDWRAMVDCVMIDTAYDGKVFNVVLSDVPEKKTDYVQGGYELQATKDETTVAVKIIDMLGEEVLVTKAV